MTDAGGVMDIEQLKEMLRNLEDKERSTTFEAAFAIGEAKGRKDQTLELIQKMEEDRKVVNIGGRSVETASRDPKPEKR
jgi:uncharacterized radical SAM superfamily Fe-S cluster-containing enzyme